MILPRVKPNHISAPSECGYDDCQGTHFRFHQAVRKPLKDTVYEQVVAHRYECLACRRTFRVYPAGVNQAQTSLRVKGLAVLLYALGLSYEATSLALDALGVYMAKSSVYEAMQEAAQRVPGLRREQVFEDMRTPAMGADVTSVKCNGQWLTLGLAVDDTSGLVLNVDQLSGEDAEALQEWLKPVAEAVGAQLLVSDDADSFKQVADRLNLEHQVCKGHVQRNTEALIEELGQKVRGDEDGSLAAIDLTPEEAMADLARLQTLISTRQPQDVETLERMHLRYIEAEVPRAGEKASVAYRLRLLYLDRWNLWPRLTRYRTWRGPHGERIDGTNNGCERSIGWRIKERYRTMRGYKRAQSAVNVSRFLAWCGNYLNRGGANLGLVIA
jgi:transposase-like protein